MERRGPEDERVTGLPPRSARSGDFSQDPAFDPEQLFLVIGREEDMERVSEAMRVFLNQRHTATFERAVAVFIRSARARGDPVERVLAVLFELAQAREGFTSPHEQTTDLRWLVLRAVLLAFYGDNDVAEQAPGAERRSGAQ